MAKDKETKSLYVVVGSTATITYGKTANIVLHVAPVGFRKGLPFFSDYPRTFKTEKAANRALDTARSSREKQELNKETPMRLFPLRVDLPRAWQGRICFGDVLSESAVKQLRRLLHELVPLVIGIRNEAYRLLCSKSTDSAIKPSLRFMFNCSRHVVNVGDTILGSPNPIDDPERNLASECIQNAVNLYPFIYDYENKDNLVVDVVSDFPVMIPRSAMTQSIINLIRNAFNAIRGKEGGVISVSTRRLKNADRISVRDNGDGMNAALLQRFFDSPLLYDKTLGVSGSLGIAYVRNAIQSAGGKVTAVSKEGKYSEIRLDFPPPPR